MSIRKAGQVIAGTPNITTGHHVGEIFWTSRLDNELNGAVEANGAVYSVEAFTGEQSVPELLRKGSLPFVSMAEYESIVSANGSCRAFGWDNGDTFRVPTVKALLLTKEQAAVVGNGKALGLTNGSSEGYLSSWRPGSAVSGTLALSNSNVLGNTNGTYASNTTSAYGITTDTEKSGVVANLDVVEYRAMVQLSTGVKEDSTQLKEYKFNNPHFFGESMWTDVDPKNGSWLVSNGAYHSGRTYGDYYKWLTDIKSGNKTVEGVSVKSVDDEYTDYDFVINTSDTTFRLPLKTKLASGSAVVGNGMTVGLTDGAATFGLQTNASGASLIGDAGSYGKALPSGDGGSTDIAGLKCVGITTDPDKSGIETSSNGLKLYFYVGDTLQDPALINAGGVLSDVADSIKRSSTVDRETVVGWGMPDYSAGVELSVTDKEQTFTCPKDGFVRFMAGGFNGNYGYLKVNDETIINQTSAGNGYVVSVNAFTFVQALSICKFKTGYTSSHFGNNFVFYPLKGVN